MLRITDGEKVSKIGEKGNYVAMSVYKVINSLHSHTHTVLSKQKLFVWKYNEESPYHYAFLT